MDGAGRSILGRDAVRIALQQTDIALLGGGCRERQMQQIFTRHEVFLFHIDAGFQGDSPGHTPLLLDLMDHGVQPFIDRADFPARQPHQLRMLCY